MKTYLLSDCGREFVCDTHDVFAAIAQWWGLELARFERECDRIATLSPPERIEALGGLVPADFVFCPQFWVHHGVCRLGQSVPTGYALQHFSDDDQEIIRVAVRYIYGDEALTNFLEYKHG